MIVFTMVYFLSETLGLVSKWGRYLHLLWLINDRTSLVRREPIVDMNHLVVISFNLLLFSGSMARDRGRV